MTEKIVEIEFLNSDMKANGAYAPDQYGNEMPYYEGFTIVKDRAQSHTVDIVRERKWCHRQRYKKDVRFTVTTEQRWHKYALVIDDQILIHPYTYDDIRACTATRHINGGEGVGAYIAQTMMFAMERPGFLRRIMGETE